SRSPTFAASTPRPWCVRSRQSGQSFARSRRTHASAAGLLVPSASTISRLASLPPCWRTTLPVIGSSTSIPNTLLRAVPAQWEPLAAFHRNCCPLGVGITGHFPSDSASVAAAGTPPTSTSSGSLTIRFHCAHEAALQDFVAALHDAERKGDKTRIPRLAEA